MNKPLLFILCGLLLVGCNYDQYNYGVFEGNWVKLNYLDTVQKYRSVYMAKNQMFEELYFERYDDSITFLDEQGNTERHAFTYKTSNSITLNAPNKPALLYMTKNTFKVCYDLDSTKIQFVQPDKLLVDTLTVSGIPTSGKQVINSIVLGGIYKQQNNSVPVQFYVRGAITGWGKYQAYKVCLTNQERKNFDGDVVILYSGNNAEPYTWGWDNANLKLTALEEQNGVFVKTNESFDLHKLK